MEQDQPVRGLGQAEDWVTASLRQDLPRVLDKAAALTVFNSRGGISWSRQSGGFSNCAGIHVTIVNINYILGGL